MDGVSIRRFGASPKSKTTLIAISLRALSLAEHTETETMLVENVYCYHSYKEEKRVLRDNDFLDT